LKNIELEAAAVFTGHSGVAFGAKPAAPFVPLWVCFLAVQWLVYLILATIAALVERLRLAP
jgi:fructose-specific phosphotransferase system IIC component